MGKVFVSMRTVNSSLACRTYVAFRELFIKHWCKGRGELGAFGSHVYPKIKRTPEIYHVTYGLSGSLG